MSIPTVKAKTRKMTRGERNIWWIEKNLFIPEGRHVGKPFRLAPFQKDIILSIYDNPKAITRRAIVSLPRKAAKTTLSAAILALHLCGPEAVTNGQLYSAARSRDQAAILFKLLVKMIQQSPRLLSVLRIGQTKKTITCPDLGTVYIALSKDADTALGLSPVLVVHDELGAVRGPSDELYDALESASAAQDRPLTIVISTQARDDAALLSLLIDDAKTGADPAVVLSLYEAPKDADPFCPKVLAATHPAWDSFVNQTELLSMQKEAKRIKSKEASFRNFILNQRIDTNEPFVALATWKDNGDKPESWHGKDVYLGIDLSQTNDLTAVVLTFKDDDGKIHVHSFFWTPEDGLDDRERRTRTPLKIWRDQGLLNVVPGPVIDYDFVANVIVDINSKANIKSVAYDAYRFNDMKSALIRKGISETFIDDVCKSFRQTTVAYEPAITHLENHLLRNELRHGMNPMLGMCMANLKVVYDSSRNRKFDKISAERKIDGAIALTMAVGAMSGGDVEVKPKSYLETSELLVL